MALKKKNEGAKRVVLNIEYGTAWTPVSIVSIAEHRPHIKFQLGQVYSFIVCGN